MPIIVASDVSYELPTGRRLLSGLSFALDGELVGLVGANGVGKSMLAALLAGEAAPTSGRIRRDVPVQLHRQREAPPPSTVAEYLSGVTPSRIAAPLLTGIPRPAACDALSGGEWMRVRLAAVAAAEYLILDEPTNDLDREGRAAVHHVLRARRGGTLLISHDREALELCTAILELSAHGLARHGGGWSSYAAARDLERGRLRIELERAKQERARVRAAEREVAVRQEKRARRGKERARRGDMPKVLIGARASRARATRGRLESAAQVRIDQGIAAARAAFDALKVDAVMRADIQGTAIPGQKLVAEAIAFNVHLGRWIFAADVDFAWRGNVRIALRGPNGAGKSTLLRALCGTAPRTRGTLRTGGLVTLYVDQRCSGLDERASVLDNVRTVAAGSEAELRDGLARFLFAGAAVFQRVGDLSGGERLRAALARAFLATRRPELLLLDEPTNNLDLANVAFLESVIASFEGAVVVVSHDDVFLEHCRIEQTFELVR